MLRKGLLIFLGVIISGLILPSFIYSEQKTEKARIVVFDFDTYDKNKKIGEISSQKVRDTLTGGQDYEILERKNMEKILQELHFSLTDMVDATQALEIGKFAGAKMAVIGFLDKESEENILSCTLLNVETSVRLFSVKTRHEKLETACVEAARKIREKIEFESDPENNGGLSWDTIIFRASSEKEPKSETLHYRAGNAFDGDMSTSWIAADGNYSGWLEDQVSSGNDF